MCVSCLECAVSGAISQLLHCSDTAHACSTSQTRGGLSLEGFWLRKRSSDSVGQARSRQASIITRPNPSQSSSLPSSPRAKPPDPSKWLTGKLESISVHGHGTEKPWVACADAAPPGGASSSACSSSPLCAWAHGSCLPRAKTKCECYRRPRRFGLVPVRV